MSSLRSFPLCVLSAVLLCGAAAVAQEATPAVRIVNRIDEKQLVTLKGTVHPLANARNDRGAAPDDMQLDRMHLVLKRSSSQETALRQLIGDMHTPGAASYHKWLTPEAFGKQFGPADQDITTVENWLSGHGFNVAKVNPGKQTIEFSGNVRQFRSAFHAQIHKYQVNGESHYANSSEPQIPAALSQVVGGFVALNNFRIKSYLKPLGKATYDPKTDKVTPEWTTGDSSGVNFVLAPQDFAVQYDLNPLYSASLKGAGQSIAIINESNINVGLVNQFRTLFSLPANPPQVIIDGNDPGVDGINNPDGPNFASTEAYLDVEWAGAVAPLATVDLVIGADTALESGLVLAMEHAVYGNIAPVMSLSFGQCESVVGSSNAFYNALWEQAAAQGITVMVSTGDNGSAGCDNDDSQDYATQGLAVNGIGSTPFNVAVGGTDFYYSDYSQGLSTMEAQIGTYWNTTPSNITPAVSILGVIPEQPWNNSQYGQTIATLELGPPPVTTSTTIAAASGGSSTTYTTKPAWQTGFGDGARDLPDVSLFAANGDNASFYPICATDGDCQPVSSGEVQIYGVGGTSASSPAFAGIMALVNEKYGRQGQANYVIYPLSKQFPAAFNDVKNGTNSVPCEVGSTDCITVTDPATDTDGTVEGQIGTGTTADYNAATGYDLASGLGTIDANQLVTNWGSVKFASTTTTLTPSSTSFTHGTAVTISGAVKPASGTASGDVALMTSSTEPGQQGQTFYTLDGTGSYTGNTTTLPGGTYNIWGQYSGDSSNAESSSTPVSITVNPESSGIYFSLQSPSGVFTSASAPGTSVDYGTQLAMSAQVAPTADVANLQACKTSTGTCPTYTMPTGTVAFSDNSTAINTAVINAEGDAEYNAPFSVGAHSVTAKYSGDNSYSTSTATAIPFTVVKDTPTIQAASSVVDSSNGDVVNGPGQPTVLTILVENNAQFTSAAPVAVAPPTGTVTVSSSPSLFSGTATLSSAKDPNTGAVQGVATFTVPAGSVSGNYTVSAAYNGDGNYNTSTTSIPITVETTSGDGAQTATIAATVTGSISPTTTVTISGTVSGPGGQPAPTGGINVYSSGNAQVGAGLVAGTANISTFSVTLNSQSLFQGSNQITIQYFGDATYNPSALVLSTPISNPLWDFTLVPQSPIVPVTAGSSGTTTINVASVNGFSSAVNLTCTAASGVTCSITSPVTLTSGGSGTSTLTVNAGSSTVNGSYNVLVTGKTSSGSYVHTLALSAVVSGGIAPTPGFTMISGPAASVAAGAASGNTSWFGILPSNGFTGAVDLTCAVTTTPTGASSPITCSIPASAQINGASALFETLTIASTSSTTTGAYVVTIIGKSGSITQTTTANVTVTGPSAPSFTLSNSAAISVVQGATTGNTSTISVVPSGGFTGTVDLTCAVTTSPTGATSPITCTPPAAADITGTSAVTGTLTIDSTAGTDVGAYVVTVTGKFGTSITQTTPVNVTVTSSATAGAFTLSPATSSPAAIAPGGTATANITVNNANSSNPYTGNITFTCAQTSGPSNASSDAPLCDVTTSAVAVGSTTPVSVLTIAEVASSELKLPNKGGNGWLGAGGGAVLAFLVFMGIPARRRSWRSMLGAIALMAVLGSMVACGGGGGGGTTNPGNPGTAAGTYVFTVTGTGNPAVSPAPTATITVVVN